MVSGVYIRTKPSRLKGRTYIDIYGIEGAKIRREKQKNSTQSKNIKNTIKKLQSKGIHFGCPVGTISHKKNQTFEKLYGLEKSKKIKNKISSTVKQKYINEPWRIEKLILSSMGNKNNLGKKRSDKSKEKSRLSHLGIKQSLETIRRRVKSRSWYTNTPEHNENIRKALTGNPKLRINMIRYIKEICGGIRPNIGRNEKQILDKLETLWQFKIIRQHSTIGYFLDGYIPELNLAIEIDEPFHESQMEKDQLRQQNITNELGCIFLRIKDDGGLT